MDMLNLVWSTLTGSNPEPSANVEREDFEGNGIGSPTSDITDIDFNCSGRVLGTAASCNRSTNDIACDTRKSPDL